MNLLGTNFNNFYLLGCARTVVVTGSRTWKDEETVKRMVRLLGRRCKVIHGDAPGLDKLFGKIAKASGLDVKAVPAPWERFGKAAGPIRNRVMLDMSPDLVLAFHKSLKASKGTRDCILEAFRRGICVQWVRGG